MKRKNMNLLFVLLVWLVAPVLGGAPQRLYEGDERTVLRHADTVADWAMERGGVAPTGLSPDSALFQGEWDLGACQMTVLGLAQVIEQHPGHQERYLPAVRACGSWLASADSRDFGAQAWGGDELGAAYVGYSALALVRWSQVDPEFPVQAELDAMVAALALHLDEEPHRWETYPGQTYPPDLAVCAAALAQAGGHEERLGAWLLRFRAESIDPETGLLIQSLSPMTGAAMGLPRASGTSFAVYFLSFADPQLSASLYRSLQGQQRHLGPFGGVREFPPGVQSLGDIDSGPVILGIGVSPTGFSLAGARLHRDRRAYVRNLRTARLFGVPVPSRGGRWYATGGGLGNAILLAMSTA